jgi:DNA (cytosine-5)-methyltransferase 1
MTHLDLFSGIGGFALAAKWVWGGKHHIYSFVEIDPFCQKVLAKNFPGVPIHGDIKTFTYPNRNGLQKPGTEQQTDRGRQFFKDDSVDLLTGGFPCQSFSHAGKRRGTGDDRYLWPEMFRIIRMVNPQWIIAENVPGIISIENGLVFEQVCSDLESENYQVQTFIIPACAVDAPHRRDRVWIVAHSSGRPTKNGNARTVGSQNGQQETDGQGYIFYSTSYSDCHAPDSSIEDDRRHFRESEKGQISEPGNGIEQNDVADPSQKLCNGAGNSRPGGWGEYSNDHWNKNWPEVATRLCRVDDGVSRRVDRLKSLGNAIVPQVVYPIMQAIKHIEEI